MKHSKMTSGNGILLFIWILTLICCGSASAAHSQTGTAPKKDKVHITSDRLVSDQTSYTDFIGNVKTKYQGYDLTSDKLRLIFYSNKEKSEMKAQPESSIKTIVASGNVIILFDNKKAVSEKAEYFNDREVIILSGKNARIISGDNSVSGSRIRINRKTNAVTVESSKSERVEAVFYSESEGKK